MPNNAKEIFIEIKLKIQKVLEFLMGIVMLYILVMSIYEMIVRISKPEEFYSCVIRKADDNGNPRGSPLNSSIRISWPFQLSELWVKQTGNALIDDDRFDVVFEGAGDRDHVVAGRQSDGKKVFSLDRVSGNYSVLDDRTWTKGVCTRKLRDF